MSEGGGREYRADDRVWAGQMTGQHGPVLRFMRHDAQRELEEGREEEWETDQIPLPNKRKLQKCSSTIKINNTKTISIQ